MSKRLAIVQSCYIPWKGYFDLIRSVDEFVLYDDVQYTVRDWRNRNQIKTQHGLRWLSIPVQAGARSRPIQQVVVSDPGWPSAHWEVIRHSYARAANWDVMRPLIEPLYLECDQTRLSAVNHRFLSAICRILGIRTRLRWSSEFELRGDRTDRLVNICRDAGAGVYVSGPSARAYIDADAFAAAGIALEFFDYDGYPEYRQLFPPFEHRVSVLDLLFNEGHDAARYLKAG